MKVDQNDETNPDTLPAYPCDASKYLNVAHSPSGHLSGTDSEPGKHSRMGSPFLDIVYPYVRSHPALLIAMLCLCYIVCFVFTVSSPSFSLDRRWYRRRRCWVRLRHRRPGPSRRTTRQANPLEHNISPTLILLSLALEMPCYCSDSTYSNA